MDWMVLLKKKKKKKKKKEKGLLYLYGFYKVKIVFT